MNKRFTLLLIVILTLMSGCAGQKDGGQTAAPTVQIGYSSWRYEQGYEPAAGWLYEMTISSESQIAQLEALLEDVSFAPLEDEFLIEIGYRLTFRNADGAITQDVLFFGDALAGKDGLLYSVAGADGLNVWLDGLQIAEQDIAG